MRPPAPTRSRARPEGNAAAQLQLRVLRGAAISYMAMLPLIALLYPAEHMLHSFTRIYFFVHCLYVVLHGAEEGAQRHGRFLLTIFYAMSLMRAVRGASEDSLLYMVVSGTHRLLPLAASVFGGRRTTLLAAFVSALTPLGVILAERLLDGTVGLPASVGDVLALRTALTAHDRMLITADFYHTVVSTGIVLAVTESLRRALELLTDALAAKQQFITNMVRVA